MKRNLKINLELKPWSFDMRSNIIIRKIFVKVDQEKKETFQRQQLCHETLTKCPH